MTLCRIHVAQLIEVRRGNNPDIRIAVVRRIIGIIRDHQQGDFVWESQRCAATSRCRRSHGTKAGLEDFLMREFFGDAAAARRWTRPQTQGGPPAPDTRFCATLTLHRQPCQSARLRLRIACAELPSLMGGISLSELEVDKRMWLTTLHHDVAECYRYKHSMAQYRCVNTSC